MKYLLPVALASAMVALTACSSSDDDDGDGDGAAAPEAAATSEPGSFQVTFTNMTAGQLMTPPVVAIHSPTVHLFQVGEISSDAVRDIAETGANAELVAFAGANPDVVSAAGVAGDGPFAAGTSVTINLDTTEANQVLSAVNMLICTNDGISGIDSVALPADNNPVTFLALPYDAGTRVNQLDALTFFPPPCAEGDFDPANEAVVEDPRIPIGPHAGQSGVANASGNWDFGTDDQVLMVEVVRL